MDITILTQAPVSAFDAFCIASDTADLAAAGVIPEPDPRPEPVSMECPLCHGTGASHVVYDPQTGRSDNDECRGCRGYGQVYDLEEYFSLLDILDYLEAS